MGLEAMQHGNEDEIEPGFQFGHNGHQHVVVQSGTTLFFGHDERKDGGITLGVETR